MMIQHWLDFVWRQAITLANVGHLSLSRLLEGGDHPQMTNYSALYLVNAPDLHRISVEYYTMQTPILIGDNATDTIHFSGLECI